MTQATRQGGGFPRVRAATDALRARYRMLNRTDPDGLRLVATVSVWVHWSVAVFFIVQLLYRPTYGLEDGVPYWLLLALLMAFNGYVHYRLRSNRPLTWHWILGIIALDVVILSGAVVVGGGFNHFFFHLIYYPVLAGYAAAFTSFRLTMVWVTVVAVLYLAISLTVGAGVDIEEGYEKALFARIFVMYAVAASVSLICSFERNRWRAAAERERAIQRERVEFSQAVHDTTAQSAFLIGLGIDAAKRVAGDSNEELSAMLEATSLLSKNTIWELRHPIDMGSILEGRELGRTLDSHVSTFTSITSVEAELSQNGQEPPLPVEARSRLFTIAHNALTNAFRHAGATRVLVELDFGDDEIRLSVSDDGSGLPDDYGDRGHGFANMRMDAERLGGHLVVEPTGPDGGASVTCVIPLALGEREGWADI